MLRHIKAAINEIFQITDNLNNRTLSLILLALVLLFIMTIGFAISWSSAWANHGKLNVSSLLLVTPNPNAPPTPTPFQPLAPTPTILFNELPPEGSDELPDFGNTPSALGESIQKKEGQVDILLLGSDQRPNEGGFRTDVIMFISINKKEKTASIISFPRDLYVVIPGYATDRINTAFRYDGFYSIADTLQYNFGIRPDYYALTNFWSFVDTVDSLGGIDVEVAAPLQDKCEPPKTGVCSVPAGLVHMDGETALWYVRSRRTTNDFDRTRRGRDVVSVIFFDMMSLDAITRFPELYNIYKENVETNMTVNDILPLLPVASKLASDPDRIHLYGIGTEYVTNYITPGGAMVLLPNQEYIQTLVQEAIGY